MLNIKQFLLAVEQLAAEKNIPKEKVLETVEFAVAAAYKKENDLQGYKVKAAIDPETGKTKLWQEFAVVTEELLAEEDKKFNPKKQILLKDAQKKKKSIKVGDVLKVPLKTADEYGRIASQTAKQVIIQKIKEVEKETTLQEYQAKQGEVISGIVQREEHGTVFIDIGRTNGLLLPQEQIPNERYHAGQRLKVLLSSIREDNRGPVIFLSRNRAEFLKKLLELEIPEINNGSISIKAIAREAGKRSKIAVASEEEGIDPIGACVGQRGTRISAVINELNGENIDIVLWHEDIKQFIANALSPAKIIEVKVDEKQKEAKVLVDQNQLSLAIGKGGQNVRLAVRLTGWKIDVLTPEQEPETTAKDEPVAETPKKKKTKSKPKIAKKSQTKAK